MSDFWSDLRLLPYFMCANSKSSDETAQMRSLAWAFAVRLTISTKSNELAHITIPILLELAQIFKFTIMIWDKLFP